MHLPKSYKLYKGIMLSFVSEKNRPLLLAKGVEAIADAISIIKTFLNNTDHSRKACLIDKMGPINKMSIEQPALWYKWSMCIAHEVDWFEKHIICYSIQYSWEICFVYNNTSWMNALLFMWPWSRRICITCKQ